MVFTTGYQANLGVISGLCGPDDTVLLDLESHASIYDGARLSGAQVFAFRHNSASDLARKLVRVPNAEVRPRRRRGPLFHQRRRRPARPISSRSAARPARI